MKRLMILALVGLMMTGCMSYVTPGDALSIHGMAGNAAAMYDRIDEDANCPDYVKVWAGGNALGWANMDAWAKGRTKADPNTMK